MASIRLVVDEIKAVDRTDGIFDDFGTAEDEVYFVVSGNNSTGQGISKRVDGGDFEEGQTKKNIELGFIDIPVSGSAALSVNVSEEDIGITDSLKFFGSLAGVIGGIVGLSTGTGWTPTTIVGLVAAAGGLYQSIGETEDSIGSFVLGVNSSNNGLLNFLWTPTGNASTTLISQDFSSATFQSRGSGSNYRYTVTAEVVGSQSSDLLVGTSSNDRIDGGDGDDTLKGESGNDTLKGSGAQDWLYGGQNNDLLNGGEGDDRLFGEAGQDTLRGESGQDLLEGGLDRDLLDGGSGDDRLFGQEGNDTLKGGGHQDRLYGGLDDDRLEGEGGEDWLYGEAGNDTLIGGSDVCRDLLFGGEGDDLLDSGLGDDYLNGGAGFNTLIGGSGYDTFVITSLGYAFIKDFQVGTDRIALEGLNPADLQFTNSGGSVFIGNGTNSVAQLLNVQQGGLSDADFLKLITRS
jgi:Ca2+-binding RTX toxin-like protein